MENPRTTTDALTILRRVQIYLEVSMNLRQLWNQDAIDNRQANDIITEAQNIIIATDRLEKLIGKQVKF
jgi:hypothetical protein